MDSFYFWLLSETYLIYLSPQLQTVVTCFGSLLILKLSTFNSYNLLFSCDWFGPQITCWGQHLIWFVSLSFIPSAASTNQLMSWAIVFKLFVLVPYNYFEKLYTCWPTFRLASKNFHPSISNYKRCKFPYKY